MNAALQFGELPEPTKRHGAPTSWRAEADALRARLGEWALLTTRRTTGQSGQFANHIRTGKLAAFRPAGAFEAASRGFDVWVRFVGDPS